MYSKTDKKVCGGRERKIELGGGGGQGGIEKKEKERSSGERANGGLA